MEVHFKCGCDDCTRYMNGIRYARVALTQLAVEMMFHPDLVAPLIQIVCDCLLADRVYFRVHWCRFVVLYVDPINLSAAADGTVRLMLLDRCAPKTDPWNYIDRTVWFKWEGPFRWYWLLHQFDSACRAGDVRLKAALKGEMLMDEVHWHQVQMALQNTLLWQQVKDEYRTTLEASGLQLR